LRNPEGMGFLPGMGNEDDGEIFFKHSYSFTGGSGYMSPCPQVSIILYHKSPSKVNPIFFTPLS
jgi:hypothetical protein